MKQILTIQDLSCLGKCSLTVAQPILSAMGISTTVLPTAVLSTHTAFPEPHIRSLTEDIEKIAQHWESIGAKFDAILVGYLSDPEQAEAVYDVISRFPCPVILDPVMGDHGKRYQNITQEHIAAMQDLSRLAEIILPNVTEASLLTGVPYQEQTDGHYLRQMLDVLSQLGRKSVVITGTAPSADQVGYAGCSAGEGLFSYHTQRQPKNLHGTGDMFSAVFAGAYVSGKSIDEAAELAAAFVEQVIAATEEASPFGANFETQLPWLWQQLQK